MLVVVSRAAWRLKLRGSLRTETSSSPPLLGVCAAAPDESAGGVERHPPRTRAAEKVAESVTSRVCLVKS
jgi:hypothetical protein